MNKRSLETLTGAEFRLLCRRGQFAGPTAGVAQGFAQVNLVILREQDANDFKAFCRANPKPCPLLEVLPCGEFEPKTLAPQADLRTDLPAYRVYRNGKLSDSVSSIQSIWEDDFVAFLIGCSYTFDAALIRAGVPVRHVEEGRNVPMYRTNILCTAAGSFEGPLVVSMRPMTPHQAEVARQVTSRFEHFHGAPIHVGDAGTIGIVDIGSPDYGDSVSIKANEIPVFWACGVTPTEAIIRTKPAMAITHEPGHMFVCDVSDEYLLERSIAQ